MSQISQCGDAILNILTSFAVVSAGSDTSSIFSGIFSTSEVLENNNWHSSILSKGKQTNNSVIFFSHLGDLFPANFLAHSTVSHWQPDAEISELSVVVVLEAPVR